MGDSKIDDNNEEQGASNVDVADDLEVIGGDDEIIVEDETEDDNETNEESEPDQSTSRSGNKTGLRQITKPPGSHRNMYERKFSYATINMKERRETNKTRSDKNNNRWINRKKSKCRTQFKRCDMSEFMDVIMLQLSKDDRHA